MFAGMKAILGPQGPMVTEVINKNSSMAVDSPYCSKQRAAVQAPQCSRMGLSGSLLRVSCPYVITRHNYDDSNRSCFITLTLRVRYIMTTDP